MTTRIGSLFTGYGGLDMAAHALFPDARTAWVCDIKPAAVALLEHRFPGAPNLGDITAVFRVDPDNPIPDDSRDYPPVPVVVEPVDVLTFGWPCQPHSSAGKRLGELDPRALLPNVIHAVAHLQPRVLLGENVARVTSNGELRRALRALAALGYVGSWRCVTAAEIGAPHKRDRLALVAVRADAVADTCGAVVWDEPGRGGRPGGAGAGVAGDDGPQRADRLTLLPTPHQNCTTGAGTSGRDGGLNLQTAVTLLPTPSVADSRNTRNATAGRTPENDRHHSGWTLCDVAHADRWGVYAAAVHRWEQILGREAPAPTQTSPRTGKPQLAPPFVEWMMGLPQGWVTDVPGLAPRPAGERNAKLSLLGDGVVPQQLAHGFRLALAGLAAQGVAA